MRFAWDPRKAHSNWAKHGVAFEEAVTVFADPLAVIAPDEKEPDRSQIIGESLTGRTLFTVFIEVNHAEEEIRIISARLATKRERRAYQEGAL